jgi:hypothetical protein
MRERRAGNRALPAQCGNRQPIRDRQARAAASIAFTAPVRRTLQEKELEESGAWPVLGGAGNGSGALWCPAQVKPAAAANIRLWRGQRRYLRAWLRPRPAFGRRAWFAAPFSSCLRRGKGRLKHASQLSRGSLIRFLADRFQLIRLLTRSLVA